MGVWDAYSQRIAIRGGQRQMRIERTQADIERRIRQSPSYRNVKINGIERSVVITRRPDMSEKNILALPEEHLPHGGIVEFADTRWLIAETDADNEMYERGIMLRCNHQLRWIGKDGQLKEKWCVIEDGTKYLIGEHAEEMMTVGDARIALTIGKDSDTAELTRGMRFLIDDPGADNVLAYQITKPNRLFNVYDGRGVYRFILTETNLTSDDNVALRVADYSNWKPPIQTDGDHRDSTQTVGQIVSQAREEAAAPPPEEKEAWL